MARPFRFNNKARGYNSLSAHERALQKANLKPLNLRLRADEPPERERVRMEDATPRQCRWPYGEGDSFRFCGQRTVSELSPWCEHHFKRVYPLGTDGKHYYRYEPGESTEPEQDDQPIGCAA